jgi:glucokinase
MIAGIDIGGTKIALGLIDSNGRVVTRAQIPVEVERGPVSARERILKVVRQQVAEAGVSLKGIGIACTGPVDPVSGELGKVNTLPGWQGWNPVRELAEAFSVTVAMENDADGAALGEARWGVGRGKRSLVSITVGTGIGAGIILNGELYRGASHSHPEIGHHIVEPDGPLCTCGAFGCWESLASGPAFEQWYAEQNPHEQHRSGKEICSLARAAHPAALQAVEHLVKYLGLGISNVVSMLTPEVIALSGSVMQSADLLLEPIRAIIRANCRLVPVEHCEITLSSLGVNAGLLGAAQVWHSRFDR